MSVLTATWQTVCSGVQKGRILGLLKNLFLAQTATQVFIVEAWQHESFCHLFGFLIALNRRWWIRRLCECVYLGLCECVYLGLVQERSLYMTPPPQVLEQSDHWDQADHWPWTALGPCSPYLTHWPLRHHWRKECEREGNEWREKEEYLSYQNSSVGPGFFPGLDKCPAPHLDTHSLSTAKTHSHTHNIHIHVHHTRADPSQTQHSHTSPPLSLSKYHLSICEAVLSPAGRSRNASAGMCTLQQQGWKFLLILVMDF